jgi:hypothetical protein
MWSCYPDSVQRHQHHEDDGYSHLGEEVGHQRGVTPWDP